MNQKEKLLRERRDFYRRTLLKEILPYWLNKIDRENGGFYTCYNVFGDQLISKDKYVWSQGRCVWLYAKLALTFCLKMTEEVRDICRERALWGCDFLERYCLIENQGAAYVLNEWNEPYRTGPERELCASSFSDCFVAMGIGAAGMLSQDGVRVRKAVKLLEQVTEKLKNHEFRTAPDVLPKGWNSQAPYMILINTAQEIAQACHAVGLKPEERLCREICRYGVDMEKRYFMVGDRFLYECLDENFQAMESLYGRHIHPGHTIECMWFLIRASRYFAFEGIEENAWKIIKSMDAIAWDREYGGMFYYLDKEGKTPHGEFWESEKTLADGVLRDWQNKMWWPQLEAMYANLLGYLYYGDEEGFAEYEKYHQYAFHTFPHPDPEVGEWIQIRDRQGNPRMGEVGGRLPVKDPFHLMRTLLFLVESIDESMKIEEPFQVRETIEK